MAQRIKKNIINGIIIKENEKIYLTQEEFYTFLQIGRATLDRWIKMGMPIKPMPTIGKGIRGDMRIDLYEVLAWLKWITIKQ